MPLRGFLESRLRGLLRVPFDDLLGALAGLVETA